MGHLTSSADTTVSAAAEVSAGKLLEENLEGPFKFLLYCANALLVLRPAKFLSGVLNEEGDARHF
jgi:hypothetical protein